jgi:hypothetical protein
MRLPSRPTNMSNLFSDSIDETEKLLVKTKKVKKGSTLEEARVEGAWLTAYAQIARRYRDDRDFGVTRFPYELGPGVNPFAGGYFEHREWPISRGMERHASLYFRIRTSLRQLGRILDSLFNCRYGPARTSTCKAGYNGRRGC